MVLLSILVERFILTSLVPKLTGNFSRLDLKTTDSMAVYQSCTFARPLQKCSKWLARLGKLCLLGRGNWVKYIHFFKNGETKIWKDWPNHSSGYILSPIGSRERCPFSGLEWLWPFWLWTILFDSNLNPGFTLTSSCKKKELTEEILFSLKLTCIWSKQ